MNAKVTCILLACSSCCSFGAIVTADLSGLRTGPVAVTSSGASLQVRWKDQRAWQWEAGFSLDSSKPLIAAITMDGRK